MKVDPRYSTLVHLGALAAMLIAGYDRSVTLWTGGTAMGQTRVSGFGRMNGELGTEHGRRQRRSRLGAVPWRDLLVRLRGRTGAGSEPGGPVGVGWLGVLAGGRVPKGLAGRPVSARWTARSLSLVADRSSLGAARYEDLFTVPLGYRAVR